MKRVIALSIAALGLAAVSAPAHAWSIWDLTPWGSEWR